MNTIFEPMTSRFVCPRDSRHQQSSIILFLKHLQACQSHVESAMYICSFNQFHWCKSQKERAIHQAFECPENHLDLEDQVIYNLQNELILPLVSADAENLRKFYMEPKPQDRFPNIMNFYHQMSQNQKPKRQKSYQKKAHQNEQQIQLNQPEKQAIVIRD